MKKETGNGPSLKNCFHFLFKPRQHEVGDHLEGPSRGRLGRQEGKEARRDGLGCPQWGCLHLQENQVQQ